MTDYVGIGGSDLFSFDNTAALESNILYDDTIQSKVEYDEYAVYRQLDNGHLAPHSPFENFQIAHKISHDDKEGAEMLEKAFRQGHLVSYNGTFGTPGPEDLPGDQSLLEGRVRRVVCFRRAKSKDGSQDGLSLDIEDFEILKLHPATLQYSRRTTTESRFWSKDGTQLSIVLSFSSNAKTPYDFLSMTYNITTRCATILIRQSYHPRRHRLENLDEYDHRMEACRAHWSHPFVTPVVLLQVHFMRTEEAVALNNHNVTALEKRVSDIAGFEATAATEKKISRKHHWYRRASEGNDDEEEEDQENSPTQGIMSMTNLMKRAHEVLKESIELMDALRWTERAVKVLIIAGDELVERTTPMSGPFGFGMMPMGPRSAHPNEEQDAPRTPHFPDEPVSLDAPRVFLPPMSGGLPEHLGSHWHDIRQYLESLLRICMSLETERRMSEARCRAQIDIIYSKMAQEDNVLNARMAVASTRDSSSMKALAVITAIFLPGEFLGTLFGMSMFDWMAEEDDPSDGAPAVTVAPGTSTIVIDEGDKVLSGKFYIYWCFAIPLTILILSVWRGWWVTEDRYFRRHLSKELSEERYWTVDGKPRVLEKSFLYDFFRLSARWDETQPKPSKKAKEDKKAKAKDKDKKKEGKTVDWSHFQNSSFLGRPDRGEQKDVESLRHVRSMFAKRESILRRRPSEVV